MDEQYTLVCARPDMWDVLQEHLPTTRFVVSENGAIVDLDYWRRVYEKEL